MRRKFTVAGHPGSITTCHAGSAAGAFDALRLMVKQHDAGKYLADADVRVLLRQLIDVVVHCRRDHRGFTVEEVYFDPDAKHPMATGHLGLARSASATRGFR